MAERGENTSLWVGLAVGLSAAAALGVFGIIMFLMRRRDQAVLAPAGGPPLQLAGYATGYTPNGEMMPSMPIAHMSQLPPSTSAGRGASYATSMRTYTLSSTRVSRIFTAVGTRHWKVTVRVVGPPGNTFAFVGPDAANVALSSGWNTTVVAVGTEAPIRLRPGDVLYGRGNTDNTVISMIAYEDDDA